MNNYYKPGAATNARAEGGSSGRKVLYRIFAPDKNDADANPANGENWGLFYLSGNVFDGTSPNISSTFQSLVTNVNNDNWLGLQPSETPAAGVASLRSATEFAITSDVNDFTQSASDAFNSVLDYAGASLVRDAVDTRIITETRAGTYTYVGSVDGNLGIIDSQEDVGGWPVYDQGTILKDTDGDGMPDDWETEHGLNPASSADGIKYNLSSDYTNLEVYLNSLVERLFPSSE